jgi:DNA mismatch endonuclease (patch repair protein)
MSRVKNKNTRQEVIVRSLLHRLGFRFRLHVAALPGTPDIVLPKYKAAIFVNGCFWHGHSCNRGKLPVSNRDFWNDKILKNIARDKMNSEELKRLGWRPIIVWGCETGSAFSLNVLGHRLLHTIHLTESSHPDTF